MYILPTQTLLLGVVLVCLRNFLKLGCLLDSLCIRWLFQRLLRNLSLSRLEKKEFSRLGFVRPFFKKYNYFSKVERIFQ
jgi:hypothetical protein